MSTLLVVDNTAGDGGSRSARSPRPCPPRSPPPRPAHLRSARAFVIFTILTPRAYVSLRRSATPDVPIARLDAFVFPLRPPPLLRVKSPLPVGCSARGGLKIDGASSRSAPLPPAQSAEMFRVSSRLSQIAEYSARSARPVLLPRGANGNAREIRIGAITIRRAAASSSFFSFSSSFQMPLIRIARVKRTSWRSAPRWSSETPQKCRS